MPALEASSLEGARWSDVLYISVPRPIAVGYMFFLALAYVIIATHTPLAVFATAGHDDGLYMSLGRYLADGAWLGPYNHVTLIKGAGYPAFLAVGQWLGLPFSLGRAIFHCFAVSVFVIVMHRFVRSFLLSGLLFTLLLWHPISLSYALLRIIRDNIYYGQVLLILASLIVVLWPPGGSRKILSSVVCGLVLGWFWLTREEGVWILPGILLLIAVALWTAFRTRRLKDLMAPLAIILCIFVVIQVGVRVVNLWTYGKFVAVEVKDRNFERALGAINSVRSGGNKPFVSATKAARERIYAVSPAFASLKGYFDTGAWEKPSCDVYAEVCGEIAAGWFMWALRDAVAATGHFTSPTSASLFFKQIGDEVLAACAQGQLECSPQFIPEMPQTSLSQLTERLPPRFSRAVQLLLLIKPPLYILTSGGTEAQLTPVLRFLNYPVFTKSPDWVAAPTKYRLSGWYHRTGHDWIAATVRNTDGSPAPIQISRVASPDIQIVFNDPDASRQRFDLETTCVDQCKLQVETPDGQKQEKTLGQVRTDPTNINVGGGTVHFDSAEVASDASSSTRIEKFCNALRTALLSYYFMLSIPVLIVGILSFFVATILYWRVALMDMCYTMALVSWMLVLVRAVLLILIDATAFLALDPLYLAPAYFLLMSGAVLSCAALLNLKRSSVEFPKAAV